MAFEISAAAEAKRNRTIVEPNLVLEIDGVAPLFAVGTLEKYIRIGDDGLLIGDDWVIGGKYPVPGAINAVTFDGTSSTISQQLLQDRGAATSISAIQIGLIDKLEEITQIISPGFVVDDIMGRRARVYLGFRDTSFPEDYQQIFNGIIDEVTGASTIILNIAHPETKKRAECFISVKGETAEPLDNSETSITLDSVADLLEPADGGNFLTYVRIDDEIIQYGGIDAGTNTLTGCTRGALGTTADTHDDGASFESFYRLKGTAFDLARKLLLSGGDVYFVTDLPVTSFAFSSPTDPLANAIFFQGVDLATKYGVTQGDFVTTDGATDGDNNVTLREILDLQLTEFGTYIVVDGAALDSEATTGATASFNSQWNVLPDGAGLGGDEVDLAEFERIETLVNSNSFDYDFYLKDTITLREFVDSKVLMPSGLFSLPRKGRVSLGLNYPPLAVANLPKLDETNVVDPDKSRIKRSINKYFYNSVVYRYSERALDEKFERGYITVNEDSKSQIRVGNKPLKIDAPGVRPGGTTDQLLRTNSVRFLDRYSYAAEEVQCKVHYGVGYNIEVGDIVLYGSPALQVPDTKAGSRDFAPRLFEVVNKSMDIKTGDVRLTLVDTNYLTTGRYGIFAPASKVDAGSTTTALNLKRSFGTEISDQEFEKWVDYVGVRILIHDIDWTTTYETTFLGFAPGNPNQMLIEAIGGAPPEDFIVDIVPYPDGDLDDQALCKNLHVYFDPSLIVFSGASNTEFEIGALVADQIFVGATVLVRKPDWSIVSPEATVIDVSGTTVTVDTDLGFTPAALDAVELIGFKDLGQPYRWL